MVSSRLRKACRSFAFSRQFADVGLTLADIMDEIEHFFECPFSELVCKLEIVNDYGDKPVPTFVVSRK